MQYVSGLENENVHGTYTKISWKKERSELSERGHGGGHLMDRQKLGRCGHDGRDKRRDAICVEWRGVDGRSQEPGNNPGIDRNINII